VKKRKTAPAPTGTLPKALNEENGENGAGHDEDEEDDEGEDELDEEDEEEEEEGDPEEELEDEEEEGDEEDVEEPNGAQVPVAKKVALGKAAPAAGLKGQAPAKVAVGGDEED